MTFGRLPAASWAANGFSALLPRARTDLATLESGSVLHGVLRKAPMAHEDSRAADIECPNFERRGLTLDRTKSANSQGRIRLPRPSSDRTPAREREVMSSSALSTGCSRRKLVTRRRSLFRRH